MFIVINGIKNNGTRAILHDDMCTGSNNAPITPTDQNHMYTSATTDAHNKPQRTHGETIAIVQNASAPTPTNRNTSGDQPNAIWILSKLEQTLLRQIQHHRRK